MLMKKLKIFSALAFTIFLTGCATGAKMENMVVTDSSEKTYSSELKRQVSLDDVIGGEKTNPAWTSEISNESFRSALKISLESQGLYSENGKYALSANLLKVDQPMFGLDLTVTTHIKYQIVEKKTGKIIFDKTVIAPYTATVGDAIAAIKRLRLANEGSGKANIKNLLSELANMDITDISIN